MEKVKQFIDENGLSYDWRCNNRSFIVWMPFRLIEKFLVDTKILERTECEHLNNCGVMSGLLAVDLTEAFYNDEIEKYFPM